MSEIVGLKCGSYSASLGILDIIKGDKAVEVSFKIGNKRAIYRFDENGTFANFAVESGYGTIDLPRPHELKSEGVVMVCKHISPTYVGQVYRRSGSDGLLEHYVCPQCVELVVKDNDVTIMDQVIWDSNVKPCVSVADVK